MLDKPLNQVISSSSFWIPEFKCPSGWTEHGPFAFWLAEVLRPERYVELGTQFGFSYFAFCQAFKRAGTRTSAYAVDTWRGDEHAGFYGEDVYNSVKSYNCQHYRDFSTLMRTTFADAASHFGDGTVDLLHIDGRHYYDDVKQDYAAWEKKLTSNGVALFHDTNVHERDFGVWKFFKELSAQHPAFEFYHGHGLGVVVPGGVIPDAIRPLFEANADDAAQVRRIYAALGKSVKSPHKSTNMISCVVVVYNMLREAERTLFTLSQTYQKDIHQDAYEVIVVDNGSTDGLQEEFVLKFGENFRFMRMEAPTTSPAPALNFGAKHARGNIIVSMIDGARMLSPGCLAWTRRAFEYFNNPAVIVPGWYIGPDGQNESVKQGYNQRVEDELFKTRDWRSDGYNMFELCERLDQPSEGAAWFGTVAESGFIGVSREVYNQVGGFEERFTSAGGGAVNLDFFRRVCEDARCEMVSLFGEGTFHQFHGGVSTNVPTEQHPWLTIHEEYKAIRGRDFAQPDYIPIVLGQLSWQAGRLLAQRPNKLTQAHNLDEHDIGHEAAREEQGFRSKTVGEFLCTTAKILAFLGKNSRSMKKLADRLFQLGSEIYGPN